MKEEFLICECGCHALRISQDIDPNYEAYYVGFWNDGSDLTLTYRLQSALRALRGIPNYDDLVFSRETMIEMRDKINEFLETIKNKDMTYA